MPTTLRPAVVPNENVALSTKDNAVRVALLIVAKARRHVPNGTRRL